MQARKEAGLSQERLAMIVEVSRSACSQWERGIATPSVGKLSMLAQALDVAFEWLATGRGEARERSGILEDEKNYGKQVKLTPDQKEILEKYKKISDKKKNLLLELIRIM